MDELIALEQSGSVQDYINDFVKLLKLVDVREDVGINCFIRGLKDDIEVEVRMGEPKTLQKAFSLDKLHEQHLSLANRRYSYTQPTQTPPLFPAPSNPKETYLDSLHDVKIPNDFQLQIRELTGEVQILYKPSGLSFPTKLNENQPKNLCCWSNENLGAGYKCRKECLFEGVEDAKEVVIGELGKLVELKAVNEEETEQETNPQLSIDSVARSCDGRSVKAACFINFVHGQHMRRETIVKDFPKQEEWDWLLTEINELTDSFDHRIKENCIALRERHHTYEYHVFKGFFHRRHRLMLNRTSSSMLEDKHKFEGEDLLRANLKASKYSYGHK